MGADKFMTVSKGKNADVAFSLAVRQARWDYGHAGYTGTIAEKHDYVLFKPLTRYGSAASFDDEMKLVFQLRYDGTMWVPSYEHKVNEDGRREALKITEARGKQIARKNRRRLVKRFGEQRLVKLAQFSDGDKWGPCACIPGPNNQYMFIGLASC